MAHERTSQLSERVRTPGLPLDGHQEWIWDGSNPDMDKRLLDLTRLSNHAEVEEIASSSKRRLLPIAVQPHRTIQRPMNPRQC